MKTLHVVIYDWNKKDVKFYDVVPFFVEHITGKFKTREELKAKVISSGKSMFWSRCEWEIAVSPFPHKEWLNSRVFIDSKQVDINSLAADAQLAIAKATQAEFEKEQIKIDVWDQIESNLEILLDILEPMFVKK